MSDSLDFSAFSSWGTYIVIACLLVSLILANVIKKVVPFLRESLIPTSVLAGILILIVSSVYTFIVGEEGTPFFNLAIFDGRGYRTLEVITYHTLALGFIASAFKTSKNKLTKKRAVEVLNTGVTTVSTYLVQAIVGLAISIFVAAFIIKEFYPAAGALLCFGYGQGTGQALNYGIIYEKDGFVGGSSFGLTIAALGFLSASIGGVIHLNILRKFKKLSFKKVEDDEALNQEVVEEKGEIPMQESIDKFTIQIALIGFAYILAWGLMFLLSWLIPSLESVIYGFNFIIGVLTATLVKLGLKLLRKWGAVKKEYTNNFLLTRASNFFFDIMVVAGIAAIRLDVLKDYWGTIVIIGILGAVATYFYVRVVCKKLFPKYPEEQFLMMYGMLTGTASTGIILLREIDGEFKTPASDNLVYQNIPAIVLGFPMMLVATYAMERPLIALLICIGYAAVLNLFLFRSKIFVKRGKKGEAVEIPAETSKQDK